MENGKQSISTQRTKTQQSGVSPWLVWLGLVGAVVVLSGMLERGNPGPGRVMDRREDAPSLQQPASAGGAGRQEREICGNFLRTMRGRRPIDLEPEQLRALAYCQDALAPH